MPLVTICFDQVFDLVPSTSKRKEVTFFNFISGTSRQYAVPAPGKPTIQAGMVVTAYLREEENWQTLVGWKNHSSNEVVVESRAYEAFFLGYLGLLLMLLFYISPPIVIFSIFLLGIVWGGAWALTSMLRIRRIESILRSTQRP